KGTGVRRQGSGVRDEGSRTGDRRCSWQGRDFTRRARKEAGGTQMTWESFYLVCFLVGLFLSAFTLLGGMGHFGGVDGTHVPHMPHAPHVHIPHGTHVHGSHVAGSADAAHGTATVPWWNASSIMIFLCWFGAAGFLLTR